MKKKLSIVILLAIVAAMILPVTFAWFSDKSTSDIGITSYVHKSYFESGDGSSDEQYAGNEEELGYDDDGCAYEIKYPVQFYYFSWLQYLGYFNQAVTETTTINQKYFYLSDDLDMTGWVLPPVGTAEFPFLGHFDGNGHTISNLTVQNVASTNLVSTTTLSDVPETIGTVEVVGLFGVVGSTENDGTVKAAVENEGLFTPSDDDYTYNHANNVIKNFTLTDVTLKADAATHNALIGAVAGYLNATVAHADVTAATLCVANGTSSAMSKTNISDYSVIGYNAQAPSASATAYIELAAPTIDNTNTLETALSGGGSSSGEDWGNSINMSSLFMREQDIYHNYINPSSKAANNQYQYTVDSLGSGSYNLVYSNYNTDVTYYISHLGTGTYAPLSVNDDYTVKDGNSGYIVGGHTGSAPTGANVRVARYPIYNLDTAYNGDMPQVYVRLEDGRYLKNNNGASAFVSSVNDASLFYIAPNNGGVATAFRLYDGSQYLYFDGRFTTNGSNWMYTHNFCFKQYDRSDRYLALSGTGLTRVTSLNNATPLYIEYVDDAYDTFTIYTRTALSDGVKELTDANKEAYGLGKTYESARENLTQFLDNSPGFINGLHFMNTSISASSTITVPKALVGDNEYTVLPQNCIDFNVKKSGNISFFAGTYYQSYGVYNKAFFSLHKINRNANGSIASIQEINKVYKRNNPTEGQEPFAFYFSGTDTYAGDTTNYTLMFDTTWIAANTSVGSYTKSVFYFEIPVNAGEYALGSTTSDGAYLFYLDISASGGEEQTVVPGTSIVETQTRTTYNYQYVSGVGVTAVSAPDGVRAETVTSPTASAITKTISVAGMTADNVFILPTTDTVTDSAAVVKYLGKTEVITQRTIMTGTVNDVDTTIIVTKTTTKTYDASDVLTSTVNTISATNNGEATETPSGFAASTLVKPATAVQYHFYDPGGITVSFTTDAEIVESAISLTEYSATVTGGSVTVIVDTVPAGKTLNINGTPVSAGNTLTTPAP